MFAGMNRELKGSVRANFEEPVGDSEFWKEVKPGDQSD